MKIIFNGQLYALLELEELAKAAPFFKNGLEFMKDWISGKTLFLLKTSGSTGIAQTVNITRAQIEYSVSLTMDTLKLTSEDQVLLCLAPDFIATKMMLARCLILDMNLVLVQPTTNPFDYISPNTKIDFASFVPLQIRNIIDSGYSNNLRNIRNVLIGGGPISVKMENELLKFKNNIYHTYGMTETVSHIALRKLSNDAVSKYFKCMNGIEIKTNENQCLVIKSAITNHQEVETKDVVELKNLKEFRWLGRLDNLINSGGVKIIPEQVESYLHSVLNEQKITRNYFLFGIPDEILGQKLIMVLEGKTFSESLENYINEKLSTQFGKYHIPKKYVYVKSFARTESGKIKRRDTVNEVSKTQLI